MTDTDGQATVALRVAELLCSRLCHDLIGPAAAVSNGLELLDDGGGAIDADVMSLLTFSVGQAAGRLMFFRVAYGLGGDNADALTVSETANLVRGIVEADKISVELPAGDNALGRAATKTLLNAALVGLETLPGRGRMTVAVAGGDPVRISVVTEGEGVAIRPEVRAVLRPDAAVDALTARTVQGHFTAWLAAALGGSFGIAGEQPGRIEFAAEVPAG